MWCGQCEQDVPGVATTADPDKIVCPKCQAELRNDSRPLTTSEDSPSDPVDLDADFGSGNFPARATASQERTWDDDFAELDQLLAELGRQAASKESGPPEYRFDAGYRSTAPQELASPRREPETPSAPRAIRMPRMSWFCWLIVSVGLMLFTCGGVLLGWSFFTSRTELWRLGLPLSLCGQVLLVIGLILQLESIWTYHRHTAKALARLHGDLHRIEHAATMIAASHSTPAQSFYLHLAERASPHLLLADLKGQLDLLAMHMSQSRSDSANMEDE